MSRPAVARHATRHPAAAAVIAIAAILPFVGCGADVGDGLGPIVSEPDVEGTVTRGSSPAVRIDVELHDVAADVKVFDTRSDQYGSYRFSGVKSGLWEVRAESETSGDFASVRRRFFRSDGDGQFPVANLDIFGHGAALVAPEADANVKTPTPFEPLDFHWSSPDVAGVLAQVQVFDSTSQDVWRSSPAAIDSARWYGYGTEGSYQGVAVGPGLYEWRVKFVFPDTTEARTERRLFRLL